MVRQWLRKLLGLDEDKREVILALNAAVDKIHTDMLVLRSDFTVTIGDEFSPQRKVASDLLGQKMREKLLAENWARKHTTGEFQGSFEQFKRLEKK